MKVLLVAPAIEKYLLESGDKSKEVRMFRFSLLSLLTVAASIYKEHEVQIVDEHIDHLDFDEDIDVVGVSFMTAHSPRAYEIGDEFLKRGKIVIFGGFHPTFMPEEAGQHCSAVSVGEAENIFPQILFDIEHGSLKKEYSSEKLVDMSTINEPPRHLLKKNSYITINAVETSRGCTNSCEFCSIHKFHKGEQRFKPINNVMSDVEKIKSNFILFMDDNLISDENHAKELFKALIPLKKKWVSQVSIKIAENTELIKLAEKSGCIGIFTGLESINKLNLASIDKSFNKVENYIESIKKLHSHGIGVEAGLMFGFDEDDCSVFEKTMEFTEKAKIDAIQASIVTPLPGTKFFETLKCDGRIIDYNWRNYDFRHVVFAPKKMTPQQLQDGADWMIGEFYSTKRIINRIASNAFEGRLISTLIYTLPVNIAYHIDAKRWGINAVLPTQTVL
jgi:radical SAM superfamily enzyme YgiQ (UPF0313 family)